MTKIEDVCLLFNIGMSYGLSRDVIEAVFKKTASVKTALIELDKARDKSKKLPKKVIFRECLLLRSIYAEDYGEAWKKDQILYNHFLNADSIYSKFRGKGVDVATALNQTIEKLKTMPCFAYDKRGLNVGLTVGILIITGTVGCFLNNIPAFGKYQKIEQKVKVSDQSLHGREYQKPQHTR